MKIELIGIELENLPIDLEYHVGVLLYHEYPVTTLYADSGKLPIIKEWVDCDDNVDRYIFYQSTKDTLKQFIEGDINQRQLIRNSKDKLVYFIDEYEDGTDVIKLVASMNIPDDYLPSVNSFFKADNGVETNNIVEFFDLNDVEIKTVELKSHLQYLAKNNNAEIFNLHLKKGNGIRHGMVDTDVLGSSLLRFDSLFKELSLDYYLGKNRGELKISSKEKDEVLGVSTTEVFLSEAASYVVYLKLKHTSQIDMFEKKTTSKLITENLFKLISISKEEEALKEAYFNYSDFVFKSYRDFLKSVKEYDVELDLSWADNSSDNYLCEEFTLYQADKIMDAIDNIHTEELEKFKVKGKFRAINCNTGYFTFFSIKEEQYHGYFDKLIKDSVPSLMFTKLYEVSVERKTMKDAGSPEPKIMDRIIAHYELPDE